MLAVDFHPAECQTEWPPRFVGKNVRAVGQNKFAVAKKMIAGGVCNVARLSQRRAYKLFRRPGPCPQLWKEPWMEQATGRAALLLSAATSNGICS